MSQKTLIKICRFSGILGLLFILGSFLAEINFLHIRNDDELLVFGLFGAVISFLVFVFFLKRKMHLYGGILGEKIIFILAILLLIVSVFILFLFFSFNLTMV